jgi:hypothetical protein
MLDVRFCITSLKIEVRTSIISFHLPQSQAFNHKHSMPSSHSLHSHIVSTLSHRCEGKCHSLRSVAQKCQQSYHHLYPFQAIHSSYVFSARKGQQISWSLQMRQEMEESGAISRSLGRPSSSLHTSLNRSKSMASNTTWEYSRRRPSQLLNTTKPPLDLADSRTCSLGR